MVEKKIRLPTHAYVAAPIPLGDLTRPDSHEICVQHDNRKRNVTFSGSSHTIAMIGNGLSHVVWSI